MARVKKGVVKRRKHKKALKKTKGYRWGRKSRIRIAYEAILHAEKFRYRDRRTKKRDMRALWIIRINAALKPHNISYSKFIAKLKGKKVELDRKVLSQIALEDPKSFDEIVKKII